MLDDYDRAILRIIQKNNQISQREIGEQVHLSGAAVQRRVRRMEQCGVIQANVAVVNPASVGMAITLIVEVELASETAAEIHAAKSTFLAAPEVQQCYYVTGEIDFMLVITVPTMEAYESLTQRLFFRDRNIKKFKTYVSMDRVKTTQALPV